MIMYESFWSTKNSVNNIFGFDAVFYCSAMSLVWIEGELNKNNGYTIHLNFICLAKSRLLKKSKGTSASLNVHIFPNTTRNGTTRHRAHEHEVFSCFYVENSTQKTDEKIAFWGKKLKILR